MVNVIFLTIRNCYERKDFAPSGGKLFLFGGVPILKREAIEENHMLDPVVALWCAYFFQSSGYAIVYQEQLTAV